MAAPTAVATHDNFLRIGDIITLKFLKYSAYLSSEGILVNDLGVSSSTVNFEDHLFQVCIQLQYSASNGFEEFVNNYEGDLSNIKDKETKKHYNALMRGKENEIRMNENFMRQKCGTVVKFGETIQLRQIKSSKFLTVINGELARDERENLCVALSQDGSMDSWLQLMPRFKINKEGDKIANGTEVLLRVAERLGEFIHCADKGPPLRRLREVNSSTDAQTPWRLTIFTSVIDQQYRNLIDSAPKELKDRDVLVGSDLVIIRDPETHSVLMPISQNIVGSDAPMGNDARDDISAGSVPSIQSLHSFRGSNSLTPMQDCEAVDDYDEDEDDDMGDAGSVNSDMEYAQEHGELVLRPMEEDKLDSNALWVIESKTIVKGGPFVSKSESVHLRHLNTGKYLYRSENAGCYERCKIVSFTDRQSDAKTLFSFHEIAPAKSGHLAHGKVVQIRNGHFYLERDVYNDRQRIYTCFGTRNQGKAVSLVISRYQPPLDQEAQKLLLPDEKSKPAAPAPGAVTPTPSGPVDYRMFDGGLRASPYDVFIGIATKSYLNQYLAMTVVPPLRLMGSEITVWPGSEAIDRSLFTQIIEKLILFIQGYPIVLSKSTIASFVVDKKVSERRQKLFREQGIITLLLEMLSKLKPLTKVASSNSAALPQSMKSSSNIMSSSTSSPLYMMGKGIVVECLKLLLELIRGNAENQMFIAGHMLTILSHVIVDPLAGTVTKEMLSSNRELQETMIKFREISIFAEQLRQQEMNSMCLQLLHACCSCQGVGIPRIQLIINQVLYEDFQDVLIQSRVEFEDPNMYEKLMPYSDLYLPSNSSNLTESDRQMILGSAIIVTGYPSILLNWTSHSPKYSAMALFSRIDVNVIELFQFAKAAVAKTMWTSSVGLAAPPSVTQSQRDFRNNQVVSDRKRRVAEFFSMQLLLAAELCLGRNYRIIAQMETYYPYELLVTILRTSDFEDAKVAASRLLLSLYIDRDPQLDVMLPRLCRTWSEVASEGSGVLIGHVEGASPYKFGLVQVILAEHLKEVIGHPFMSHTTAYLELLHSLVKFSFYGDIAKLQDIIEPMVKSLARNGITGDVPQILGEIVDSTATKSKKKRRQSVNANSDALKPTEGGEFGDNSMIDLGDGEKDLSDSDIVVKVPRESLFVRLSAYLETVSHLVFMWVLALLAVGASIYLTLMDGGKFAEWLFKVIVVGVFSAETVLKLTSHILACKPTRDYFTVIFNWIDLGVIALNFLALFTELLGPFTLFSNAPRIVNIVHVFMSYSMMRNMKSMVDSSLKRFQAWVEPERYLRSSGLTIKAIVEITGIVSTIQKTIDDRNISLFLKAFHDWRNGPGKGAGIDACGEAAVTIFKETCAHLADLSVSNDTYDTYYIDLLMYRDHELVQRALDVLMTHHSSRKNLQQNLIHLQLLVSPKREAQYSKLEKMVTQMRRDIARHDVWGKLSSDDDRATNEDVLKNLSELVAAVKHRRAVLAFDEDFEPDITLQGILRNIGCFDLCVAVMKLISTIDHHDPNSAVARNTKALISGSNDLLYWFIFGNASNQALAMDLLPSLINSIDDGVGSHRVITAIFKNNEQLMKYVPKQYITDFANMICNNGKRVQYLSLLDAVVALDNRSLKENQYEVIRLLSSPQNIKKVVQYFLPTNHAKYAEKVKLMAPYMNKKDVDAEELPPDLAYHLQLIKLLSKCTIGVDGMTSIEAKVQSMFFFVDVISAIMDPNSLLIAKIRLGQFMYNALVDVEMKLPSLAEADITWKFIESTNDVFVFCRDEIRQVEKNGWEHVSSSRQKLEYMLTCANIIGGFFERYYDPTIFRPDAGQTPGIDRVTIREPRANEIMRGLFANIRNVYEMRTPLLSKAHNDIILRALRSLNGATTSPIVATVDDLHSEEADAIEDEEGDQHTAQARQYSAFVKALQEHEEITAMADEELSNFIAKIESLPRKADVGEAGVRFEPLLERLVTHAKSCIEVVVHGSESTKYISERKTATCIWFIKICRLMIERKWGMSIFERDDDGGEEQDIAAGEIMHVLTVVGAPGMCLDFIARGVDSVLQAEAIKLLVALLFREGGSLDVQKAIYAHLNRPGSDLFFMHIRSMIQDLIQWHKVKGVFELDEEEEPPLPPEIILIRFLQLTCEGHYKPNQDILRNQPLNHHAINLLDDLVQYLQTLALYPCRTSTVASLSVIATILEVIQGPCEKNQDHFAFNTELIEVLNRRMRSRVCLDCQAGEENELKKAAIEVFQALLEGQGQKKEIYDRMLSVIHLDVIKMICEPESEEEEAEAAGEEEGGEEGEAAGEEDNEGLEDLQVECLVLMQMLIDYKPSIYKELKLESVYKDRKDIACVEVFWRNQLQRRFFHVPDICNDLAKSSKDNFILTVDRSSAENKLFGLLDGAKVLYSEIQHQQRLKEWGIASIFSRTNQERSKKLSFYLTLTINLLYLGYYDTVSCDGDDAYDPYNPRQPCTVLQLDSSIQIAITVLNIMMLISSGFTLLLNLVVRVPVNYVMEIYRGKSQWHAVFLSATDFNTLYCFGYMGVVFVSLFNRLLTPFLLLDIIAISPVLQEVLQAAWKPRKSIFMSIILTWIVVYLYAIMVFFQFHNSSINVHSLNFITLWKTFAEYVRYGSFSGSLAGYGDVGVSIVSTHYIVDILFFVSVFVMWNIVKGITFDQFVEIREKLLARIKDTEEICFMCGITDKIFNRTIGRDAFKKHIRNEQNLWNYVYYIIAIWEQDKDDDDGLEWQIRRYIAAKDLSWFPMNKAVCLMMQEDVDDELDEFLRTDLKRVESEFDEKLVVFKENLLKAIGRVEGALSFDPESEIKTMKSKSSSIAAKIDRRGSHTPGVVHGPPGSRKASAEGSALILGGKLDASLVDEASVGDVTEASFSDSYSVILIVEEVLNLLVNRSDIQSVVCRIDCDVSTHNLKLSNFVENDEAGFIVDKIPTLGCFNTHFGSSHVQTLPTESIPEHELLVAETDQSDRRIVFHGKIGDNVDNVYINMVFLSQSNTDTDQTASKFVASVDVPLTVLLDAAQAKCKIDVLLQQSHGLPVPSAVAILGVELIQGDFASLGLI